MSQPGLRLSPSPWTCLMAGSRAAKRQSRSEQGFSADLLEMRMWVLMTLLAGVVRCCHQSDWFRVLTSRQRNAAGTTHCDYHLNQAAHKALISGYFHCVSATLFMTLSALGILNPLRDRGATPPCCCLQGHSSEVMVWRPQGNLWVCRHIVCLRDATSMFLSAWWGSNRHMFSVFLSHMRKQAAGGRRSHPCGVHMCKYSIWNCCRDTFSYLFFLNSFLFLFLS